MSTRATILAALVTLVPLGGCPGDPTLDGLDPPAAGAGFQLKTTAMAIPAGAENQDCYFFRVPATGETYVNRIVLRQRAGSHHLNIFRVKTDNALSHGADDGTVVRGGGDTKNQCWISSNWAEWPLVVNSQASSPDHPDVTFALPTGVAHRFDPGELLMLQSHFVNATTQMTPQAAEAWVNFEYIAKDKVTAELGTLFATNQNIAMCPGDTKFFEKTCRVPNAVTIVGANGHFHSRGTRFSMFAWDPNKDPAKGAMFYDNYSWDDPLMATNLAVPIPDMTGIIYRCEFQVPATASGVGSTTDPACAACPTTCFKFGPKVETSEHCNAFVYYYPKADSAINCF